MRLIYKIVIQLSILLTFVLTLWAVFFYLAIVDEINDEVDDSLEDYSEQIIIRVLSGQETPMAVANSNNQYYIEPIDPQVAQQSPTTSFSNSTLYIDHKMEQEPVRTITNIFQDNSGDYYRLTVSTTTIEREDLISAILSWTIFLYVSLLLIIVAVNVWVYKRSYAPFFKILKWMDSFSVGGGGNRDLELETSVVEFKRLHQVAMGSMQRAEQAFLQQKEFTDNASHELQTPLAVCRNRIENLMEDRSLSEEQLTELSKIKNTLVNITKLNKTLLLLAKIENRQFVDKKLLILNQSITERVKEYQEIFEYKNITVNLVENGEFRLSINETLMNILIGNLIRNGFVHNVIGGVFNILILDNSVTFSNTSQGEPLDERTIFERFSKTKTKEDTTGLGLSLVRSVCQSEGLTISYYFKDDLHCFKIAKS